MKLETTCKFCKKALAIEVEPDYESFPVCSKLVPMICCNRCADFRIRRRSVMDRVRAICWELERPKPANLLQAFRAEAKGPLRSLLIEYRQLAEEWQGGDCGEWDEGVLEAVLSAPKRWGNVLARIWVLAKREPTML